MISDASPVGTSRSAKKRTAFAPGRRTPTSAAAPSSRREIRSDDRRRQASQAARIPPAARNRVETAKRGGRSSTAIAIARYVEPQIT
jgi:hypothetical protein